MCVGFFNLKLIFVVDDNRNAQVHGHITEILDELNENEKQPDEYNNENFLDEIDTAKRAAAFLRFGRPSEYSRMARAQAFLRFGKSPAYLRFGKRSPSYLRFGRGPSPYMRFGRSAE